MYGQTDGKVYIGQGLEMAGVQMAESKMAVAASAQDWILGSKTNLWDVLSEVSAYLCQVLGTAAYGRCIGELFLCK